MLTAEALVSAPSGGMGNQMTLDYNVSHSSLRFKPAFLALALHLKSTSHCLALQSSHVGSSRNTQTTRSSILSSLSMKGLVIHHNLSCESFESGPPRPLSNVSFATDTSADTVHVQGIGSLSGRMIYAIGEVALRGIENLTIRRRLGKVMLAFPHKDDVAKKDIETIYDHTLELSRFGLYRTQIRQQALRVLLIQISTRHTRHLLRCLLKWPPVEITLFVYEIQACMPESWLPPGVESSSMHRELMDVYLSSQSPSTTHQAAPLLDFILTIAQVNWSTCQAVFNSGFLDMLVCMYACNFTSNLGRIGGVERGRIGKDRDSIIDAVCGVLATLCDLPDAQAMISAHPISVLWPKREPLLSVLGDRTAERQATWRRLGPIIVARRLSSLIILLRCSESTTTTELVDVWVDLREFSRVDLYGLHIAREALALCCEFVKPQRTHQKLLSEASSGSASNRNTESLLEHHPLATRKSRSIPVYKNPVARHLPRQSIATGDPHRNAQHSNQPDILIDSDGTVKGGTVPGLVRQLIAHEHVGSTFAKTFLMTFKSFTTLNELFDLIVQRFWLQSPEHLGPLQRETSKQHAIRTNILAMLKTVVAIDDATEQQDRRVLDRMREFIAKEVVYDLAAQELLASTDRANGENLNTVVTKPLISPPASVAPTLSTSLQLIHIDPLELARQLTIVESQLYLNIKPVECFRRSRQETVDYEDSITLVNRHSDRIALWVQNCVLSRSLRRRPALIEHFITVAEKCRHLGNYSSMVAIIVGLNAAPVRRLRRSWGLVSAQHLTQLNFCEVIIDPNRNFKNYHQTLAAVPPPCVPYIGVFLRTLSFIQEGSPDFLPNNIVNFRKCRKAAEVINDIQRWQSEPHNFQPVPSVLAFLEISLHRIKDSDFCWNLSLKWEPPESWGDKQVRELVERGIF